jgi:hypothetical protein
VIDQLLDNRLTRWLRNKSNRAYLYRVATTLGGICVAAHWVTSGEVQTALTDAGVLLGLGSPALSALHTPTKAATARRARKANR